MSLIDHDDTLFHFFITLFRSFLRPVPKKGAEHPSGIRDILVQAGALEHYTELCRKNVSWARIKGTEEVVSCTQLQETEDETEDIATPSSVKKQRTHVQLFRTSSNYYTA